MGACGRKGRRSNNYADQYVRSVSRGEISSQDYGLRRGLARRVVVQRSRALRSSLRSIVFRAWSHEVIFSRSVVVRGAAWRGGLQVSRKLNLSSVACRALFVAAPLVRPEGSGLMAGSVKTRESK